MPEKNHGKGGLADLVPAGRPFIKMHGLQNHFVIVDARSRPWRPEVAEMVRICHPRTGVGADQLVAIEAAVDAAGGVRAFARFWNADGSEAEACGNATRCVAWLLLEEAEEDELALATRAGVLRCRRAGRERVWSEMGPVSMDWRDIPLAEARDTLRLDFKRGPLRDPVAVNVGNPHLVFFVPDADAVDLEELAPGIQRDPLFPRQVNVGVAQLVEEDRLRLRVYERGAGLTMACGSGACAAARAALARGLTRSRVLHVELPGGELDVEIRDDGSVAITGPVAYCFRGYLPV